MKRFWLLKRKVGALHSFLSNCWFSNVGGLKTALICIWALPHCAKNVVDKGQWYQRKTCRQLEMAQELIRARKYFDCLSY